MWGATDSAYVLWMALRGPRLPWRATLRLAATVVDLHTSPLITFLVSALAYAVSQWLAPEYYRTPEGLFVVELQNRLASIFFYIGLATGAVYEWYSGEVVAALRRAGLPGEELMPHSSGVVFAEAAAEGAASRSGRHRRGAADGPPARKRGELECVDTSPLGTLSRCSRRRLHVYLLRLLPWLAGPLVALAYFALPAIVAQTTLIFRNRQRSAHVSPKSSPTSSAATERGAFSVASGEQPQPQASPRRSASPAAAAGSGLRRRS